MSKSIEEFVPILRTNLKFRDFDIGDTEDDNIILRQEIERAISEINKCRRFDSTAEKLYDAKYESLIIPLCLCSFAKIGAEGQTSHSENGVARSYTVGGDYPKDMLNGIIPLAKSK